MRIGVVADTHGGFTSWKRIIEDIFRDVDLILHGGDVLYHGARNPLPEGYDTIALTKAINGSRIPILIVKGNCDSEVDQMVLDIPIQSPYIIFQDEGLKIFLKHWHPGGSEELIKEAKTAKANLLITAHTHIPEISSIEDLMVLNPGSPSLPKEGAPTVAKIEKGVGKAIITLIDVKRNKVIKEEAINL